MYFIGDNVVTPQRKKCKRKQLAQIQTGFTITDTDIEEISEGKMLSDTHINSASALIKQDFPEIKGLQSTLNLQRNAGGFQPMGEGSIQIFYCGTIKHWVTSRESTSL